MPHRQTSSPLLACFAQVYAMVRAIPRGRVMTYGQIAALVPGATVSPVPAVTVGRAMAASSRYDPDLPWWRVMGREGDTGVLRNLSLCAAQKRLLAAEGVVADADGGYDLSRYLFRPPNEKPHDVIGNLPNEGEE